MGDAGLCAGSRALARQKMMHLLSAEDISCNALFREHVASRGLRMPRMRLILFGISAFSYWLCAPSAPDASCKVSAKILKNCEPVLEALRHLEGIFPFLPRPHHVSTTSHTKRPLSEAICHLMVRMPKGKDFCRVESGVFVSCPELCFVQLAQSLPFHELVRAGNVLCGRFYLDAGKSGELGQREPLTSKRRIEAFIRANPGIKGVKEARRALPWVTEGAASPPEAFLAMVFGLPHRYGGFQLSGLAVNRRLRPSHKAQQIARRTTLVPDILFADARLAIEYDSTAEHTSSSQLTRDAQKRLALEADGYKVITVTAGQIGNSGEMRRIAKQCYRRRGKRFRPQSKEFANQQALLFRMGWSLEDYCLKEQPR